MEKILVLLELAKLSLLNLVAKALKVAAGLDTNAAELSAINPTSADLRTEAQGMNALIEKENNLKTELAGLRQQIKMKRGRIENMLKSIGGQIENLANTRHDPSLIERVGLGTRESRKTTTNDILDVPTNVRLSEIRRTSGFLRLNFDTVKNGRSYGIVWAYGAVSPEKWDERPDKVVPSSRGIRLPLQSGKTVWVRVKAYGINNTESDWSDVATRIVP